MKILPVEKYLEMSPREKLEYFMEQQQFYNMEGTDGVRKLESILEKMGYQERGGFIGASPILNFLSDNSGMIEKFIEFIREHGHRDEDTIEYIQDHVEVELE
jgi:hypothetical protein